MRTYLKIGLILVLILGIAVPVAAQSFGAPPPPPTDEAPPEEMSADVAIGAVTMDGKTYQQISLRPDIPLGKFGFGLDLSFYFDEDGNIRESDWDDAADYIDKIYYIRYGHKGDPLYIKGGALDNVTLGYGILMKYYSNSVEYPAVRRVGAEFDFRRENFRIEGMVNNFRELGDPGLMGVRASYPFAGFRFGAAFVMDGNQYASFQDHDGDGVPDTLDRFEDADDASVMDDLTDFYANDPDSYTNLQGPLDLPDPDNLGDPIQDFSDVENGLEAYSLDVGYPLWDDKLVIYGEFAQFVDYGTGFALPGVRFQPWSRLILSAEYRDHDDEFIPSYFDRTYEIERYTTIDPDGDAGPLPPTLVSREELLLQNAVSSSGIYADFNLDLYGFVNVFTSYSTMKPKDDGPDNKSLYGYASLNVSKVPKVSEFSVYYQQMNVEKLADLETESTLYGARIGYEMSPGVNLLLNYRWTFRDLNGDQEIHGDDEKLKTFALETSFAIR